MDIRPAHRSDAASLVALLAAYLAEQFPGHTGTDAATFERDVLSGASSQHVLSAERAGMAIGFVGWHRVYDMHWAKGGRAREHHCTRPAPRPNNSQLKFGLSWP